MQITVGADPEVFLTLNNAVVSSIGRIGGTKENPKPVEGSKCGLKVQEDNVALEFNINPVDVSLFSVTIETARRELRQYVRNTLGAEADIYMSPTHIFPDEELKAPAASVFGCDPDFLAHQRGEMRTPPNAAALGNARFTGGHIHIGYDKAKCPIPEWALIQGMEAFGYLHMLREVGDTQGKRRKVYGLPGLYRPKPYGVEYRTPSNFWVPHSAYASYITNAAQAIVSRPMAYQQLYHRINWDAVQNAVNTERFADPLRRELNGMFEDLQGAEEEI